METLRAARVVVTDDHAMIRKGLAAALGETSAYELVGEAGDGPSTIHAVSELLPDLVLTELVARGVSMLPVIAEIKRRYPATKIAIYTGCRSREDVITALRAGVDGYLLKDTDIQGVIAAIAIVLQGHTYLSPAVIANVVNVYVVAKTGRSKDGGSALSPREAQVLKLVAGGQTNKQIAQHLVISPRTVEKHRARLMRKIGVRSVVALMSFAIGAGFLDTADAGTTTRNNSYGPVAPILLLAGEY